MQDDGESNRPSDPFDANPYAAPSVPVAVPAVADDEEFFDEELRPFRSVWTRPRQTVRRIVAVDPSLHVVLLACLAGVVDALDRASTRSLGDDLPMVAVIGIACVFGPLGGLLGLWIGSHLIRLTGDWMGGRGNREHIKTAMAWASVPTVFTLPLWVLQILLLGPDVFTEETPRLDAQPMLLVPFVATAVAELVLGIWAFVLLCKMIAEVQDFQSAWRGLGNLMLSGLVVIVPLLVLVFGALVISGAL